jgi:hypothetical protein
MACDARLWETWIARCTVEAHRVWDLLAGREKGFPWLVILGKERPSRPAGEPWEHRPTR